MLQKGIIVSIQGYKQITIEELAENAVSAGAVAIRTDKPIRCNVPLIGLNKTHVSQPEKEAYITTDIEAIERVASWAEYVAIDYRALNKKLKELSDYCRLKKIKVVADICSYDDYLNLKEKDLHYAFIATTFSVFRSRNNPDIRLVKKLLKTEKNIIAEGNYYSRGAVAAVKELGVHNVCIGAAISDVYKLTRRFTTIGS